MKVSIPPSTPSLQGFWRIVARDVALLEVWLSVTLTVGAVVQIAALADGSATNSSDAAIEAAAATGARSLVRDSTDVSPSVNEVELSDWLHSQRPPSRDQHL